jgi:hypothetical protein
MNFARASQHVAISMPTPTPTESSAKSTQPYYTPSLACPFCFPPPSLNLPLHSALAVLRQSGPFPRTFFSTFLGFQQVGIGFATDIPSSIKYSLFKRDYVPPPLSSESLILRSVNGGDKYMRFTLVQG